ncbi:hypothetical protein BAOM_4592 [Peribacillus asahii]|uniref:Homeodomain phBC6A51-type domain-containing protein n=1 Tax=Peribacillus asahii TaxID=228899 RepID=A0A3T0KXY5_9BACI|nr:phBC6A51 family helix-turn-helix protein [Peribacillus asahii]AZV45171.1 hypothetical protein BAOM_4592 [Peribacillus asahii]
MGNEITLSELKALLTTQQLQAADTLVANDYAQKEKRSYEEIAEELGISVRTLYKWRQNQAFIKYCAFISDTKLDSFRSLADAQLIRLIEGTSNNGNASVKSLELYYKLAGKLVDRREVVSAAEVNKRTRISDDELQKGLDELNDMLN